MTKIEAYRILSKMWNDATPEQDEAINIAMDCIEFVDLMPENMVAVVHGRWMDGECGTFCTNCNRVFDEDFEIRREVCKKLLRCPNCGAHMKDGE